MNTESWYQLPPDMTAWNTAIIENMSRSMPEIANYINAINWSSIDPTQGNGDGLVEFINGVASAPVTIRGNKLAPIDIIVTRGASGIKFYPLSPVFLQKIYADNVIGEPVYNQTDRDESYEGPGKRIQHIKTVDAVKYASKNAAIELLSAIEKSASVYSWMEQNMPETVQALQERIAYLDSIDKLASEEHMLPELLVLWKDNDSFYANNEKLASADMSTLCSLIGATSLERQGLMEGSPIVRDSREKLANIFIPTEQTLSAIELSDEASFLGEEPSVKDVPHDVCMTTAYTKDGQSYKGIVFSRVALAGCAPHTSEPLKSAPDSSVYDVDGQGLIYRADMFPELFICDEGYGFNTSIKTDVRIPFDKHTLVSYSEATGPAINMVGMVLDDDGNVDEFGRIEDVYNLGSYLLITIYSLVSHKNVEIKLTHGRQFYEVTDNILAVSNTNDKTDVVSTTGINGIVRKTHDGNIIIEGESHSIVNCPYALMSKYAMAYEDACNITDVVTSLGQCSFEILPEKLAAENDNPDKTKQNRKGTKSGTDDENPTDANDTPRPQLAQQSPEAIMSTDVPPDPGFFGSMPTQQQAQQNPNMSTAIPGAPGAGQASGVAGNMYGEASGFTQPVSSKDLENVTQINSPQVVDAYMLGNLAKSDSLTGQTNMYQTSESILDALSKLSQLLFLTRQGAISTAQETDIQTAMSKLTDVANSLGITTSQVGA